MLLPHAVLPERGLMPAAEAMLMMRPPPVGEARVRDWASEGNASTVDGDVQTAPLGENAPHRSLPVRTVLGHTHKRPRDLLARVHTPGAAVPVAREELSLAILPVFE